ncbi:Phage tail sheath protein [Serratia plymuthica]|nr:Phage tail sheath protein [Serratia plymuthica]
MISYPSVDIPESPSLSLNVTNMSGLVPLLVGRFYRKDGTAVTLKDGLTQMSDWSTFAEQFLATPLKVVLTEKGEIPARTSTSRTEKESVEPVEAAGGNGVIEAGEENHPMPIPLTEAHLNTGALTLASYFDNGGGSCYLLSFGENDDSNDITAQMEEYDKLSLLAVIDADSVKLSQMNTALDSFITDYRQNILLTSEAPDSSARGRYVNAQHVATYTPDLHLTSSPRLDDNGILIQIENAPTMKSLAEFKTGNKDEQAIYATVKTAIEMKGIDYSAVQNPVISPVAAVAGAYCATERLRGVWQAPANIPLVGVTPTVAIGETLHGELNSQGINAILWRPSSASTVIMGARTRDVSLTRAWRYVPSRLLFNTVERDVRTMLSPMMFEPNVATAWQLVSAAINNYLYLLWKKGGLYGRTSEEAFQVEQPKETADIDKEILRVRIGLAALRPAEFIYLEFTQDMSVTA